MSEVRVVKTYAKRGKLQLFRYSQNIKFICSRCGREKVSSLQAKDVESNQLFCNACYGEINSQEKIEQQSDSNIKT